MMLQKIKLFIVFFLCYIPLVFSSDGIKYRTITNSFYLYKQYIHIIEIDPDLYEIKAVKALDNGIGRESVLSLSNRHKAIAAINGGFFTIGSTLDGKACGALKIHDWVALPFKPRGCIGWNIHNKPIFDRLLVTIDLNKELSVDGLNRQRKTGEIILFNSLFNKSTLTTSDGEELIIQNHIITDIKRGQGSSLIPADGWVLSIQKEHPLFGFFQKGSSISFDFNIMSQTNLTISEEWGKCDYIVGGTPILIKNSTKILDFSPELTIPTFLTNRHARTAIGILPNGNWIFVVVDKTGIFDGMSMDELSDFMISLSCTNALNLDGGGSSTIVFDGEIKNSPHGDEDEGEGQKVIRRVSDAIIVIPKK
ncbi:MAG: phosphodiester glycosidase family protein [Parachlamydiales bacterium]|jgi:exopolysaccharide biosynthesis protein